MLFTKTSEKNKIKIITLFVRRIKSNQIKIILHGIFIVYFQEVYLHSIFTRKHPWELLFFLDQNTLQNLFAKSFQ